MTCGIYKIENKINGKVYIGQSINIEQRWIGHKKNIFACNNSYNYPLYQAIRKYGLENFDFSIVEECLIEQLNEKEIYYIKLYNSFLSNGYNQTFGGQGNHGHGTKINLDQVYEIIELLKTTNKSNKEIGKLYNLSETAISGINTGYFWHLDGINYPIRKPHDRVSVRKNSNGATYYKKVKYCLNCGKEISNESITGLCLDCLTKKRRKNWPDRETLKQLIRFTPFEAIAKQYGFKSGNSPKKWCIAYNLPYRKCDIEKISDEDWELI